MAPPSYIENSFLDKDRIKITLNDYKNMILNEINNPNDPLYKLKTWWLIPEKELGTIIEELITKIENNDYDLELYSKIVNYLSHIEEMDVCTAVPLARYFALSSITASAHMK